MADVPNEVAPGLWYWAARHPDWHPGDFDAEVGAYAAVSDTDRLLIDPLLPDDPAERDALLAQLDALADGRTVTIGYHARSAELLSARYGDAAIRGPKQCASRLTDPALLTVPAPGERGPAGIDVVHVGKPRRAELPLWVPSHRALVFGDAVVTVDGALRM